MPAATHRVQINKTYNNQTWSNAYLIVAGNMAEAVTAAERLVAMERGIHYDNVLFTDARVSDTVPGNRVHRGINVNAYGQLASSGGDFLPLFNVLRVDLGTVDSDPARKYYRMPVMEQGVTQGIIPASTLATVNTVISGTLFGSAGPVSVVTSKGNAVTSVAAFPNLQMRQMHRKWARRKTSAGGGSTWGSTGP